MVLLAMGGSFLVLLLILCVLYLFFATRDSTNTASQTPLAGNETQQSPNGEQKDQNDSQPPVSDGSKFPEDNTPATPSSPATPSNEEPWSAEDPDVGSDTEQPFLPPTNGWPPVAEDAAKEPNTPKEEEAREDQEGKIDITSDSIILTQSIEDFMEEKIELFGRVNYASFGLSDMSKFSKPTIYTNTETGRRRPERFMRRPPDHLEWWKHARANELSLPEKIYRYGSKWHLFDRRKDERQVLVAWHEENPEIYIRVDSDNPNQPIGPRELIKLRSEYKQANARLLAIRKSIANIPLIKFVSTYKVNTKLERMDFQINQHFRLANSDANDSLKSNFIQLGAIVDVLPETIETICYELSKRNSSNRIKVTQVARDNPPLVSRNPVTGEYTGESQAQWQNRISLMTTDLRKEISAIDSATTNVDAQVSLLISNLREGIEILADISQSIDTIKSMPELYFTLPESLIIRTSDGDQITQKLRFDVIIRD